jgi:hypothetical protein
MTHGSPVNFSAGILKKILSWDCPLALKIVAREKDDRCRTHPEK